MLYGVIGHAIGAICTASYSNTSRTRYRVYRCTTLLAKHDIEITVTPRYGTISGFPFSIKSDVSINTIKSERRNAIQINSVPPLIRWIDMDINVLHSIAAVAIAFNCLYKSSVMCELYGLPH